MSYVIDIAEDKLDSLLKNINKDMSPLVNININESNSIDINNKTDGNIILL